jgi:SAM-dependent methyltransferase
LFSRIRQFLLSRIVQWADSRTTDASRAGTFSKDPYECIPKGKYVYGPADRFLLVPKNRYRVVLLPAQERERSMGVGWLTEDNTPEGYDLLWGDDKALREFREEAGGIRMKLTTEIVAHIADLISEGVFILDVGFGAGDLLVAIRDRRPNTRIAGCDFSKCAIERVKQLLPDGQFTNHNFIKGLPYEDSQFDLVLCTDTLEHLEYPSLIIQEMIRVCKSGGSVVVVVPDGDVDQFFGHLWFWSEARFRDFISPWGGTVQRLPETREVLGIIKKSPKE